jgi:hypothetical protein
MATWRTETIAGTSAAALRAGCHASHPPTRFNCDRACLASTPTLLHQLAAHDLPPPLAKDVKYTETASCPPPGVWKTVEGLPRYRLNPYDPRLAASACRAEGAGTGMLSRRAQGGGWLTTLVATRVIHR